MIKAYSLIYILSLCVRSIERKFPHVRHLILPFVSLAHQLFPKYQNAWFSIVHDFHSSCDQNLPFYIVSGGWFSRRTPPSETCICQLTLWFDGFCSGWQICQVCLFAFFISQLFMFQILLSLAMKVMLEQAQSNVCYWVGKRRTNIFCLSFFANNWHIWWEKCLRLYFVIILICCNAIYCCEFIQDNNTSLLYLNTHKLSLDLNF